MNHHRLTRIATLGLALAALAASTASAMPLQDLRSADARDAAQSGDTLRGRPHQDLRSSDTRDLAEGRGTFNAPEVTVVKVTDPVPSGGGLHWGDAGIGAGGMLGLILLGLGLSLAVVHRRHSVAGRHPATTG